MSTHDAEDALRPNTRTRILFMSSNGGGLGHLTRLLAIARRLPDHFEPVFLTMSLGIEAVKKLGYWVDYIPAPSSGLLYKKEWHDYIKSRFSAAVNELTPAAVVFDGTFVYRGLCDALDSFPHIFKVWSRRAMWQPMSSKRILQAETQTRSFDLILEPGEFAAAVDDGFTQTQRHLTTTLNPVVLLGPDELLSREEARRELGIDPDSLAVLLNLGAGNINSIDNVATVVAEILKNHPTVHLVAAQSIISLGKLPEAEGRVTTIETYPLARLSHAFDFCVVAPGYNSYHELLSYAVPTLFIPNEQTVLDDQGKRATWGQDTGTNLTCSADDLDGLRNALHRLLNPEVRAKLSEQCRKLAPADGSTRAASIVANGKAAPPINTQPVDDTIGSLLKRWISAIKYSLWLHKSDRSSAPHRTLFVLGRGVLDSQHGRDAIEEIVSLGDAAICLVGSSDFGAIRRHGLAVELITEDLEANAPANAELSIYAIEKARALIEGYNCQAVQYVGQNGLHRQLLALRSVAEPAPFEH
jgi:UDP:flavonoid glycosyltransferase YjiC (YdhE family)